MADRPKMQVPEKYQGRKIYSISRLTSFHNCEYGYFLNYHLKKQGKPNIYSILGTKVHDILERLQISAITTEEAKKEFDNALFETTEILGYKFMSDKVRDNFITSIRHFFDYYKPIPAQKVLMEKEFFTDVAGTVLIGFIDVVALFQEPDGNGGLTTRIEVIDYKTSSKYASKDLDEHGMQLVLYAIALEQEFGVKVSKVKWNMLKYCTVRWQGATKPREAFYLRSEVVVKLRSELKKDLRKEGMTDAEIELLLAKAEETNDMKLLPQSVQDKYKITDGYVEYDLNDKTRKLLEDFVADTVKQIEAKNPNDINDWLPKDVSKDSFFCSTLCDHKASCEFYQRYVEQLKAESLGEQSSAVSPTFDEEMKRLFG
jgi:ATP-dependent helicase/DNAse subunit B